MQKINLLSFFLLVLSLSCFSGEKNWPPKPDKKLAELTIGLSLKTELAELKKLVAQWKRTGDGKVQKEIYRIRSRLIRQISKGNIRQWGMKDFVSRVDKANEISTLLNSMSNGHTSNWMWDKWKDWASYAPTKIKFFERLVYGYKNKKEMRQHISVGNGFKQAIYKFLENNPKEFSGKKEKILFCQQLIVAGIKDPEIQRMPAEISKEK